MGDQITTDNSSAQGVAGNTGTQQTLQGALAAQQTAKPDVKPATGEKTEGSAEGNAAAPGLPTWMEQLPEDIRGNADIVKQLQKFQKIGEVAKAYTELESKLGTSVNLPGKNATQEELNSFYEKLGRPKTADKYSIADKDAADFRQLAFDANLTDAQAKAVYDKLKSAGMAAVQSQAQAQEKQLHDTEELLQKEYGSSYQSKLTMLTRGITTFGGPDVQKALTEAGLVYNPGIVKMFIALGEMAAEAGTPVRGENGGAGQYKSTAEGGSFEFKGLQKR